MQIEKNYDSHAKHVISDYAKLKEMGLISSNEQARKAMGMSSAALSRLLSYKYEGNIDLHIDKLENYCQLVRERNTNIIPEENYTPSLRSEKSFNLVMTENAQRILGCCKSTRLQCSFGVVAGKAGLGKTSVLQEYARIHPDVIYIHVDTTVSPKELLRTITHAINASPKGSLNELKLDIIHNLKGSGRLLIIDQAEYLNTKSLDILRTIHDQAGVGILLAGLYVLLANIAGQHGVNEQIYTRISAVAKLSQMPPADLKNILISYYQSINVDTNSLSPEVIDEFVDLSEGCARRLMILSKNVVMLTSKGTIAITKDLVRRAYNNLRVN